MNSKSVSDKRLRKGRVLPEPHQYRDPLLPIHHEPLQDSLGSLTSISYPFPLGVSAVASFSAVIQLSSHPLPEIYQPAIAQVQRRQAQWGAQCGVWCVQSECEFVHTVQERQRRSLSSLSPTIKGGKQRFDLTIDPTTAAHTLYDQNRKQQHYDSPTIQTCD